METNRLLNLSKFLGGQVIKDFNINALDTCALGFSNLVFPEEKFKKHKECSSTTEWVEQYLKFYSLEYSDYLLLFSGSLSFDNYRKLHDYQHYECNNDDQYKVSMNILKFIKDKKTTNFKTSDIYQFFLKD